MQNRHFFTASHFGNFKAFRDAIKKITVPDGQQPGVTISDEGALTLNGHTTFVYGGDNVGGHQDLTLLHTLLQLKNTNKDKVKLLIGDWEFSYLTLVGELLDQEKLNNLANDLKVKAYVTQQLKKEKKDSNDGAVNNYIKAQQSIEEKQILLIKARLSVKVKECLSVEAFNKRYEMLYFDRFMSRAKNRNGDTLPLSPEDLINDYGPKNFDSNEARIMDEPLVVNETPSDRSDQRKTVKLTAPVQSDVEVISVDGINYQVYNSMEYPNVTKREFIDSFIYSVLSQDKINALRESDATKNLVGGVCPFDTKYIGVLGLYMAQAQVGYIEGDTWFFHGAVRKSTYDALNSLAGNTIEEKLDTLNTSAQREVADFLANPVGITGKQENQVEVLENPPGERVDRTYPSRFPSIGFDHNNQYTEKNKFSLPKDVIINLLDVKKIVTSSCTPWLFNQGSLVMRYGELLLVEANSEVLEVYPGSKGHPAQGPDIHFHREGGGCDLFTNKPGHPDECIGLLSTSGELVSWPREVEGERCYALLVLKKGEVYPSFKKLPTTPDGLGADFVIPPKFSEKVRQDVFEVFKEHVEQFESFSGVPTTDSQKKKSERWNNWMEKPENLFILKTLFGLDLYSVPKQERGSKLKDLKNNGNPQGELFISQSVFTDLEVAIGRLSSDSFSAPRPRGLFTKKKSKTHHSLATASDSMYSVRVMFDQKKNDKLFKLYGKLRKTVKKLIDGLSKSTFISDSGSKKLKVLKGDSVFIRFCENLFLDVALSEGENIVGKIAKEKLVPIKNVARKAEMLETLDHAALVDPELVTMLNRLKGNETLRSHRWHGEFYSETRGQPSNVEGSPASTDTWKCLNEIEVLIANYVADNNLVFEPSQLRP